MSFIFWLSIPFPASTNWGLFLSFSVFAPVSWITCFFWFILSFLKWGGFISQLLCFLRKAGWEEMYFFLPVYTIKVWLLMAFWMEIIFPPNFKGGVSITFSLWKFLESLLYFWSTEIFIQKMNLFFSHLFFRTLNGIFQSGNTYLGDFFLILFLCTSYLTISLLQFIHSLFVELPLFRYESWSVSLTFQIPFI